VPNELARDLPEAFFRPANTMLASAPIFIDEDAAEQLEKYV
jgi:hypothetical protein